jgi:hypothetical protein
VQGAFNGPEARGEELFRPFRRIPGAIEDDLKMIPYTAADNICRDPRDPMPIAMHSELLEAVPAGLIDYLLEEAATPESRLGIIEMRHNGGAFARQPRVPSAVGMRPGGFWFNAIAGAMGPGGHEAAAGELSALRAGMRRWATGNLLVNGIEAFGADRVRAAYAPETWRRLMEVKRRYDPENVFRLNRNIPPA